MGLSEPTKLMSTKGSFILLTAIILSIMSSLMGCAFSQEGAVDYRKAEIYSGQEPKNDAGNKAVSEVPPPVPLTPKNDAENKAASEMPPPVPLTPVKLIKQGRPSTDKDTVIKKLDSISIRLRRGLVRYFSEISFNPMRKFEPNGEIAIVVKAFEFGKGEDFNFGPEGIKEGRLVYYSSDVNKGQILNFNNMPIYGPIEYGGNPIGIEISIVELDVDSSKISSLLGTLANFGAKAYPPAAPILPVLDALGKSLLKGGTNDIEMRFTMVFDPAEGYEGISYPTVEAGNYVFVREDDRLNTTYWEGLRLDDNTGLLYKKKGDVYELYRDNTYLTIQFNKGFSSKNIDLSQNTFGEFLAKLEEEDARRAEDLTPFLNEVNIIAMARVQTRNFSDAKVLLRNIRSAVKNGQFADARNNAFDLSKALGPAIKIHANFLSTSGAETVEVKISDADLSSEQTIYLLKAIRDLDGFDSNDLAKCDLGWYKDKETAEIENTIYALIEKTIALEEDPTAKQP